jgi:hypothetical protein
MTIRFGSLDFVIEKEGEMTMALEALAPWTSDLPNVARGLSDLHLGPCRYPETGVPLTTV